MRRHGPGQTEEVRYFLIFFPIFPERRLRSSALRSRNMVKTAPTAEVAVIIVVITVVTSSASFTETPAPRNQ